MKKKILYILFILLNTINAFSQEQKTVKGKVFDIHTKEPIQGVAIKTLISSQSTISNALGEFTITTISSKDSINISFIGYQSIIVANNSKMNISLSPSNLELQSVVVTANRAAALRTESPIAISRLSPKLIDESKASMVYELINKTPGVIMPSYNNEQHAMAIRQPMGTSAYYLYMEDGIPIRPLGVFNHNALLEINQFAISSIEVVKGPVSSIYGPEAVGGAVNFIMQRPTLVPTAKVGVQFDNWGFRRVQFGSGAKIKKFGFYVGGLSSQQTNSWMAASDYDKTSINARLEYNFTEKTRLIGSLIYGKYYSQMSGSVDSTMFYKRNYVSSSDFTYRKSDAYRSRLTLEHDWNSNSKSFITFFQRSNKHGQNPTYDIRWTPGAVTARGEINSNDFESYGVVAQHSQKFNFLNAKLILGGVLDITQNDYWSYRIDLDAKLDPTKKFVERYSISKERPELPIANYVGDINNYAGYLQYDF